MSVGWSDLGGALLLIAAGLLIVTALVALLVWDARRRRSNTVLLDVTAAVARVWLALVALGTAIGIWQWLSGSETVIPHLPVAMEWPQSLPCGDPTAVVADTPTLVCANVQTATARIADLSFGARSLIAVGDLLTVFLTIVPAIVVLVICHQAAKGAPFAAVASRWLFVAAVAILVGGLASDVVSGIGQTVAAAEVLPPPGEGPVTTTGLYQLTLPLWPIGAALGLAALGVVFRHGSVLQRETEGLI